MDRSVSDSAPDPAACTWQTMRDGRRLFLCDWTLTRAQRAVLIVHGLGEHSGRYGRLAQWFQERGFTVRSYDQRGHGRTTGQRGALRHAQDLCSDLAEVYAAFAQQTPTPPLLLGHSMGGLVALRAVLDGRIAPPGLVLSSPALRSWEPAWLVRLASVLARITPWLPLRNDHPDAMVSHDLRVTTAYENDPLRTAWITPRLADFIFRTGVSCIADASALAVPTLLLIAGGDTVVDSSGSQEFARRAASTGQLTTRVFPTLYHELFNEDEPWRGQVLAALDEWLQRDRQSP